MKDLPGTVDYNMAIMEDMTVLLHSQILTRTVKPFENVCDALILFKVLYTILLLWTY